VQKVTDPEDKEGGWTFNLYLDDDGLDDADPNESYSTVTTTDASAISFPDALGDEGHYYILEVEQVGWENQGGTGECTFDVDYPVDADRLFSCTFTNTAKGTIKVAKTVNGGGSSQTFVFELQGTADTDPGTGKGFCTDSTQAINDAQALLDSIDFTGTGSYANKMTAAQKTTANNLASILDRYSKGLLCQ
jgi:hypothetical protein